MTSKEAGVVSLAYQRCAWALHDIEEMADEVRKLEAQANWYRVLAEDLWKQAD